MPIKLSQSGEDRLQSLKARAAAQVADNPDLKPLFDKLMKLGGHVIAAIDFDEEHNSKLMARGSTWVGAPEMKVGVASACHFNTAQLWLGFENVMPGRYRVMTGWGLTWDQDGLGCWRQHSWLWDSVESRVVETTVARDMYYGYELTAEEAACFTISNAW